MGTAVGEPAATTACCCQASSTSSSSWDENSSSTANSCIEKGTEDGSRREDATSNSRFNGSSSESSSSGAESSSSSGCEDYFALPSLAELEAATCCSSSDCSEEEKDALIVKKMKNLFCIKEHGGEEAARILLKALDYEPHSVLFRHEAAYVLGQLGCSSTAGRLEQLLRDTSEDEMVRHEAAEALGALALPEARDVLEEVMRDVRTPESVQHTCQLALEVIERRTAAAAAAEEDDGNGAKEKEGEGAGKEKDFKREELEGEAVPLRRPGASAAGTAAAAASGAPETAAAGGGKATADGEGRTSVGFVQRNFKDEQFNTVDPSEPYPHCSEDDVGWLLEDLLDSQKTLWSRYRALFTLRNLNSPTAVAALATALARDTSSALLRHEIAFVLGQLRIVTEAAPSAAPRAGASPSPTSGATAAAVEAVAPFSVVTAAPPLATPAGATGCSVWTPPGPPAVSTPSAVAGSAGASGSADAAARGGVSQAAASPAAGASAAVSASAAVGRAPAQVAALALLQCLASETEHPMARHEAALALGSLGASARASTVLYSETQTLQQAVFESLERYSRDGNRVVKESCLVALDAMREEIAVELHGR